MRFEAKFIQCLMTNRLINGSQRVLNLTDLFIEYWFDGGNEDEVFSEDSTSIDSKFTSDCMVSSLSKGMLWQFLQMTSFQVAHLLI